MSSELTAQTFGEHFKNMQKEKEKDEQGIYAFNNTTPNLPVAIAQQALISDITPVEAAIKTARARISHSKSVRRRRRKMPSRSRSTGSKKRSSSTRSKSRSSSAKRVRRSSSKNKKKKSTSKNKNKNKKGGNISQAAMKEKMAKLRKLRRKKKA